MNAIYQFQPCLKKFSIMIPDSFITEGEKPKKVFDAGTLNLAGKFSGETRDCLNWSIWPQDKFNLSVQCSVTIPLMK